MTLSPVPRADSGVTTTSPVSGQLAVVLVVAAVPMNGMGLISDSFMFFTADTAYPRLTYDLDRVAATPVDRQRAPERDDVAADAWAWRRASARTHAGRDDESRRKHRISCEMTTRKPIGATVRHRTGSRPAEPVMASGSPSNHRILVGNGD